MPKYSSSIDSSFMVESHSVSFCWFNVIATIVSIRLMIIDCFSSFIHNLCIVLIGKL